MTSGSLLRTPLYEEHKALGARIVPFAGWEMPVQYAGVVAEHQAVRGAAGLFDVCHMGELTLRGKGAVAAVDRLVTNNVAALEDGRALYTVCCNSEGGILDDLIVYKHGAEDILVVCNASNRERIASHFKAEIGNRCDYRDESDATGLVALQGPKAWAILKEAGAAASILSLTRFGIARATIGSIAVTVARTGYTGEDGAEIFCESKRVTDLWRLILKAGSPFGCVPAGLGARDTLRLEARLSLYGNEIDLTTNPWEAGLGWVVKLDKGDFIGRDALKRLKSAGNTRKLVGFEMRGRGIARHGYPIVDPAKPGTHMGIVTSGSPGPTVGKNIGLGYVPIAFEPVGTALGIEIRGNVIEAQVVKTPFYKRQD